MRIILVFGPGHGQTFEHNDSAKEFVWAENHDAELDFMREFKPWELPHRFANRQLHRYRLYDVMSSMNGEDCGLFVHDENCCDRTYPEPERLMAAGDMPLSFRPKRREI